MGHLGNREESADQSPMIGSVLAKRVLVIAPSSLLKNWEAEFKKWLGSERLVVHVDDGAGKVSKLSLFLKKKILNYKF